MNNIKSLYISNNEDETTFINKLIKIFTITNNINYYIILILTFM